MAVHQPRRRLLGTTGARRRTGGDREDRAARGRALACLIAATIGAGACGKGAPHGELDTAKAATLFTLVPIDTDNGLSGIAIDDAGAIWSESERDNSVFRIVLDGTRVASSTRYKIVGAPAHSDLEAIAWLGPGKLAFGTEGQSDDRAQIATADVDEATHTITVARTIDVPKDRLGLTVRPNDGVEGLCGAGDVVIAAIESTATDERGRWAPIVRMDLATGAVDVTRLALTSDKGKLSSVDCTVAPDGSAKLLLIERHFAVTKFLRAELPAHAAAPPARLEPKVAIDLEPVLNGTLNLEGIGVMKDGRVVAVVDNQYDRITGPNELLVFKPGAVP